MTINSGKMADSIEILFGIEDWVDLRNEILDEGSYPHRRGILGEECNI